MKLDSIKTILWSSDSIPVKSRLSALFFKQKLRHSVSACGAGLSASTKPVVWVHVGSRTEWEILHPFVELFSKDRGSSMLMTFPEALSAKLDLLREVDDWADCLLLLPADAESFVSFAKPEAAILGSSACGSGYLRLLAKRRIPTFLIATKIREASSFFWWRESLRGDAFEAFTHIFVFDHASKTFWEERCVGKVTTYEHPPVGYVGGGRQDAASHPVLEAFAASERFVFVGGNMDTDHDLKLVAHLANTNPSLKCLLAPHTISEEHLRRIKYELEGCTLLCSECNAQTDFSHVQTLVVDYLGAMPDVYRYGACAYVGGGFTPHLRNVVEAAADGVPIAFGPRIGHRVWPKYLVKRGVGHIVKSPADLRKWVRHLEDHPSLVRSIGSSSMLMVEKGRETTRQIHTFISSCICV